MSLPGGLTGGGGMSASSSASSSGRSGDVGGSAYTFGGINTGQQSTLPPWATGVALVGGILLIGIWLWRKS